MSFGWGRRWEAQHRLCKKFSFIVKRITISEGTISILERCYQVQEGKLLSGEHSEIITHDR